MPVLVIPAAAAVIVALLCVLLLLAFIQFAEVIGHLVPAWHIPGLGNLRGWIVDHVHDGYNAVAGYLDQRVRPVASFLNAPIVVLTKLFDEIGAMGHDLYVLSSRIITVTIPRAVRTLRAEAVAVRLMLVAFIYAKYDQATAFTMLHIHAARSYALDLARAAQAYALARVAEAEVFTMYHIHAARSYAQALVLALEAEALQRIHAAEVRTTALVTAARAEAAGLVRNLAATVEARYQAARAFATAAAKAETAALSAGLAKALITDLETPWEAVTDAVEGVAGAAEGAFTDAVGDLRDLTRSMPRTLPAAIALTLGITVPLLKMTRDCTVPNCRNLSKVGRDLQELFGIAEGVALLGLLGEAATRPQEFANAVRHTVGPLVAGAAEVARHEIGVH